MQNLWKVLILVVVCISIGFLFFYSARIKQTRTAVLEQLKNNLKFCEVVKDSIDIFSGSGKFWLICNGRPFYATYENGNIGYELNGWSWLKTTPYWNELKNCDFYDTRGSHLIFYCPERTETYPYVWRSVTGKIYSFNKGSFSLEKVKDVNFIDTVTWDIKSSYDVLKKCELLNFSATGGRGYPPAILIQFLCDGLVYTTETNLLALFPPLALENKEKSFKTVFPLARNVNVKDNIISGEFAFSTLIISNWTMRIKLKNSIENVIKEWSILIFPPRELKELKPLYREKFISETLPLEMGGLEFMYYRSGDTLIKIYATPQIVFSIERKGEGFYEV